MSHVVDMQCEVKDLDCLAKAAKRIGLELVKDQKHYKWYGESVGDYPLPAGFTEADLGNCDHALRIPGDHDAYEIGVVKRKDGRPGFTLIWDFFAQEKTLIPRVGQDGGLLKQAYAREVARKQLIREGYRVTETTDEQGTVHLAFVE